MTATETAIRHLTALHDLVMGFLQPEPLAGLVVCLVAVSIALWGLRVMR